MKLVVEEKIKTVEKSGYEDIINTNETISKVNDIITKEKEINPEIEIEIDKDTFVAKVNNTDGTYLFVYNATASKWYDTEETPNEIDLSQYGITLTGTPSNEDTIKVVLANGEISQTYIYYIPILENTSCSFFDFSSELPVSFEFVFNNTTTINITTTKCQMNFEKQLVKMSMQHSNTKTFKTKLVVSK